MHAALRALAVEHIGAERSKVREHAADRCEIRERHVPPHGKSGRPERQPGRHIGDDVVLKAPAGRGIADNADFMAGRGLSVGEIDDMAEYAADRRADYMDDTQPSRRRAGSAGGALERGPA